jgi:hypothetical protein
LRHDRSTVSTAADHEPEVAAGIGVVRAAAPVVELHRAAVVVGASGGGQQDGQSGTAPDVCGRGVARLAVQRFGPREIGRHAASGLVGASQRCAAGGQLGVARAALELYCLRIVARHAAAGAVELGEPETAERFAAVARAIIPRQPREPRRARDNARWTSSSCRQLGLAVVLRDGAGLELLHHGLPRARGPRPAGCHVSKSHELLAGAIFDINTPIWNAPGADAEARQAFALATCDGWHGPETGTFIQQISPLSGEPTRCRRSCAAPRSRSDHRRAAHVQRPAPAAAGSPPKPVS